MDLPRQILRACLVASVICAASISKANTGEVSDIEQYVEEVRAETYDCPDPTHADTINELLDGDTLNKSQRFALTTVQTQNMICNGRATQARDTLLALIEQDYIDKDSLFYAHAIYQIGFTYDVQERVERCPYYVDALKLSKGKFYDIEMSASLGLINYCPELSGYSDDTKRIAAFFELVEEYSNKGEPTALAYIHNNIGLFFGNRDQHVLAAEQFLKAHNLGKDVYHGSNKVSILISAISSLLGTGQYERAKEAILEFEELNKDIDTPLSNFWYYFAKTGYHYRVNEMEALEKYLPEFQRYMPKNTDFYDGLYRWYNAVLCLDKNDTECLQAFVDKEAELSARQKQYVSYDYFKFLIRAHFALGDIQAASKTFEEKIRKIDEVKYNQDGFSKIIGVANLYSKIYVLENKIEAAERRKSQILFVLGSIAIVTVIALAIVMRRRHIARMSLDPVTSVLNSRTAVNEISKVDSPSAGKINAIAIFDLGNFREVNRQVGSTKGDYALQKIASTLKMVTRDNDILGRLAPEQFILCLADIEEDSAKSFFERVQEALETTFIEGQHGADISIRSSMSIYISPDHFKDLDTVLDELLLSLSLKSNK